MVGQRYVAVVGTSVDDDRTNSEAEEVGRLLAESGAVVVCGGLGGVMAAVCRGARSAGGTTVGLLPGLERAAANPWVSVALPTGLGELRNGLVVRAADAVIAIGGAWGTLSEIALARAAGTPVVGLGSWDLRDAGPVGTEVEVVRTPAEAVAAALGA